MKIVSLEVQNVKRVKAVAFDPAPAGLTTIGGRNGQGKTSVLDALAYALGGERLAPTNFRREGAAAESKIRVETDDGLVIERKGKNASLTVTDSTGRRAGQKLLDATIGRISIDMPSFLHASDKEKAATLLKLLGVGDRLEKLDRDEKAEADAKSAETPDTKATNGLTKAQLMAKLDELGIAYKARDTAEELRKRLEEVIDHGAPGKE